MLNYLKKKDKYFYYCLFIIFIALILRIIYALRVPYYISEHDQGWWYSLGPVGEDYFIENNGHINYMEYIYRMHKLPQSYAGQFYHPPLYHLLSLFFFLIFNHFGAMYEGSLECIQVLNIIVSSISPLFIFLSLEKIGVKKSLLLFLTCFISFHPCFYHIGIALNNDALAMTLAFISLYFVLSWHLDLKTYKITLCALFLGLSAFTKINALLAFPFIFMLIMYKLYEIIYKEKKYEEYKILIYKQASIFIVLFGVLAFSWPIRNYIKYGIPINYALNLTRDHFSYLGNIDIFKRLSLPSISMLSKTSVSFDVSNEYNILAQTKVTAMFDERILHNSFPLGQTLSLILIWSSNILNIIMLISMLYMLIKKRNYLNIISFIWYLIIVGIYIKFSLDYPFITTTHFRYIVLTLLALLIIFSSVMEKINNKYLNYLIYSLIIVFSLSSSLVYYLCAI